VGRTASASWEQGAFDKHIGSFLGTKPEQQRAASSVLSSSSTPPSQGFSLGSADVSEAIGQQAIATIVPEEEEEPQSRAPLSLLQSIFEAGTEESDDERDEEQEKTLQQDGEKKDVEVGRGSDHDNEMDWGKQHIKQDSKVSFRKPSSSSSRFHRGMLSSSSSLPSPSCS
jgi:hypothetical protein